MYTFDLNAALKRLNKELYIESANIGTYTTGERAVAIKRRKPKRKEALKASHLNQTSNEDRGFLDDEVQGTKDEFVMAIPYPYVPEYDQIDFKSGRILKRGWRTAALILVKKNICTIEQVRRVFRCSSLGESTYDKLGYEGKLRLCRAR